jgi:hypothetical protein
MLIPEPKEERDALANFCFRISPAMKAELFRRAELRSKQEGRRIKPSQIVRELLEHALRMTAGHARSVDEVIYDELVVRVFFLRTAMEVFLSDKKGLADEILLTSRKELHRIKQGPK